MKRITRLGTLILLAPLAGCASLGGLFSGRDSDSGVAPPAQAAPPNAGNAAMTADLDSALLAAQIRRKAGDLQGAAKALSQLVLVAPDDARVLGEYGKTLAAQGRSDDALAFLDRATQLKPGDWTLFTAQGMAHDQKGNYPAAQISYERALQLSPGEPTVLNNDALSHMQAGDLDGAERLLRQAAPGTPEYFRIQQNLALVQSLRATQVQAMAALPLAPPAMAAQAPAPVARPMQVVAAAPVATRELLSPPQLGASVASLMSRPSAMPSYDEVAETESVPVTEIVPATEGMPVSYAALKADPTVVMAPVPKDEAVGPVPVKPAKVDMPAKDGQTVSAPAASPAHTAAGNSTYYVQAGAYATEARAGERASTLDALGARVMTASSNGHSIYRVWIGPFMNVQQANAAITQAQALGHDHFMVVTP